VSQKYRKTYDALDDVWEQRSLHGYNYFTQHPWLTVVGFIVALIAISVILNVAGAVSLYWKAGVTKATAPAREQQSIYSDPQAIIATNGYFHEQCRQIIADGFNLKTAQQALDRVNARKPIDSVAQIQWQSDVDAADSSVQKYQTQLSNETETYDAKAASYGTKPFRDASLPRRIELQSNGLPPTINCH
jgi:hypothetical protein